MLCDQSSIKYYLLLPIFLQVFGENRLKMQIFSKYVNYPVISDDSGLCIKALKNKPGIYSARLAKRHGSFFKAMKFILKKTKN